MPAFITNQSYNRGRREVILVTDENIYLMMSCGILAFAHVLFIRKQSSRRTIWLTVIPLKSEGDSGSSHFYGMLQTQKNISSLSHNHTSVN